MERLVIEALNVVFEDTTLRAEDDEEVFNEDFWITEDGNRVALAEVKGVNSGVKRAHINQVDNHREELSLDPDEMPGVLVLNVHRLDTNLERKLQERFIRRSSPCSGAKMLSSYGRLTFTR